jgi:hypothetical protein
MANSLPAVDKPLLDALQTVLNRQLGGDVFSVKVEGGNVSLIVSPPSAPAVKVDGLGKDAEGIAGTLTLPGVSAASPLQISIFGGFTLALTGFELIVAHGRFNGATIRGRISVPFFADKNGAPASLDIELTPNSNGPFADPGGEFATVLADAEQALNYPLGASALDLRIASMHLEKLPDGNHAIAIDGRLILDIADLSWPSIEFHGLRIDSHGNIALESGWIDLPSQTAIDLFGFHFALQKIGFGSDNGERWVGFNGELRLVEGIPLGGSVRGLRLSLKTGELSFSGVSVNFEIPGALDFAGEIDHIRATKPEHLAAAGLPPTFPITGSGIDIFAGGVKLSITALPQPLEIDAKLIVGHINGASVFFLALGADLPFGIPIFLDVSLYGLSGMFASKLQPDPVAAGQTWWEWYKNPQSDGKGAYSATDVRKWITPPKDDALAFGAGVVIGTSHDDGFTVSAAVTLVLMFPGPIVMLIGRANILQKRIRAGSEDRAIFNALATFDGNAGTFDLAVDAKYEIPVVLDIEGSAEIHAGPDGWYFALGKPPHDKRVRARIFDLFETNGYFVISDDGLVTGSWVGYRNSWRFGPLSVSLNAYLATIAAIQWSPLQIGGGIELHGEVHLRAFGIGLGINVGALLEGCAPHPFWVHGEFHVELETPWPLPDVGATVSLTWGGDDGSVPPAPLALNHIDATLIDHFKTSDHYTLLEHRADKPSSYDPTLSYDDTNNAPGILQVSNDVAWSALIGGANALDVLPNITNPDNLPYAAVIPQDAHFTLTFAHSTHDAGIFNPSEDGAIKPETKQSASPDKQLGKDDMSNLTLNPPRPQWAYQHTLKQVALYKLDGGAWQKVAATPAAGFPRDLPGGWIHVEDSSKQPHPNTLLKITPYQLLPGDEFFVLFEKSAGEFAGDFTFQELQFHLSEGLLPASVGPLGGATGLTFGSAGEIAITFPQPMQIVSIESAQQGGEKEFVYYDPLQWRGDGVLLPVIATGSQPKFAQTIAASAPAVKRLSATLSKPYKWGAFFSVTYKLPNIRMGILPAAPAIYALKTVVEVQAGRVTDNTAFGDITGGRSVIEFAYFQTACGPGVGTLDGAAPAGPPDPTIAQKARDAALNADSVFPRGGELLDLHSYTQWSWPEDGNVAAYFGYDVNVEFNESYVNALYAALAGGSVKNSLHFRCVDRNHAHLFFLQNGIHVPSIYSQSALLAAHGVPPLPASIAPKLNVIPGPGIHISDSSPWTRTAKIFAVRAESSREKRRTDSGITLLDSFGSVGDQLTHAQEQISKEAYLETAKKVAAAAQIGIDDAVLSDVTTIDPLLAFKLWEAMEAAAAEAARALWFQPLRPRTRYTLDVVPGPIAFFQRLAVDGSLAAIYAEKTASGALHALQKFYKREDALPTLQRVQFTTSRYRTFSEQLANAVAQTKKTAGPVRRLAGASDAVAWFAANGSTQRDRGIEYIAAANALAKFVSAFDPMGDNLPPSDPQKGEQGLRARRDDVEARWQSFAGETTALFDKLAVVFGHDYLASDRGAVLPPDTELSVFVDGSDHVAALLIESPEPLPWRRIWRWIKLTPVKDPSGNTMDSFFQKALAANLARTRNKSETQVSAGLALDRLEREMNVDVPGAAISDKIGAAIGIGAATLEAPPEPVQLAALWNRDGTRAVLVPTKSTSGSYALNMEFHGNIGTEVPCITAAGDGVLEHVDFAPILFRESAHTTPHYKHDSRLRHFLTITGHGGAAGLP